jgi:hypothetical protein
LFATKSKGYATFLLLKSKYDLFYFSHELGEISKFRLHVLINLMNVVETSKD